MRVKEGRGRRREHDKRKRKAKTQTSQCQNFSLKIQSLEEGRNYFCLLSPPALHLPGWASKSPSISGTPPVPPAPPQFRLSPLLTATAHNIQAGAQPLPAWFPLLQRDVAQATPVAPPPESPVVHDRVQPVKAASQPLPPGTARPKARAQAPSCDRQKGAQADIRVPPALLAGARDSCLGYREAPQRLRARRPPSAARGRCTPRTASSPLAAPSRASAPPRPRVSLAPTSWCPARLLFHATRRYPRRPSELTFVQERSTEGTREQGTELRCRYGMRAQSE